MSNLQIKNIDDGLYQELKVLAANENRSLSQQVLFLIRSHLAQKRHPFQTNTAAQTLLSLAGSWEDSRPAEQIIGEIRSARRSSTRFQEAL